VPTFINPESQKLFQDLTEAQKNNLVSRKAVILVLDEFQTIPVFGFQKGKLFLF